jgi:hypothetical protein
MSQRRSGSAPGLPQAKRGRETPRKSPSGKKTPSPKQKQKERATPGDAAKKDITPKSSGRKSTGTKTWKRRGQRRGSGTPNSDEGAFGAAVVVGGSPTVARRR